MLAIVPGCGHLLSFNAFPPALRFCKCHFDSEAHIGELCFFIIRNPDGSIYIYNVNDLVLHIKYGYLLPKKKKKKRLPDCTERWTWYLKTWLLHSDIVLKQEINWVMGSSYLFFSIGWLLITSLVAGFIADITMWS